MKKRGFIKFCLFTGLTCILLLVVLFIFDDKILSLNRPINSKILVVEGWIGPNELNLLKQQISLDKYETIYVTGIAHDHPYYLVDKPESEVKELPVMLFYNGCLGLRKNALKKVKGKVSEIQVFAHSSKVSEEYAHFFVTIDDQIIGNSFVNEKSFNYTFKFIKNLVPKEGIYVYYNNNLYYKKKNRNLIVDSISVNETVFNRPSDFYQINDHQSDKDSYTNFPFRSDAVFAANYLKTIGLKNEIVILDTFFNKRNKTLAAATKFANVLKHNTKKINSFNVVSIHGHSRRSYLSYLTATASIKPKIGIISLDYNEFKQSRSIKGKVILFFDEYFSLFVTWIIKIIS